jgi:hypothetical protein
MPVAADANNPANAVDMQRLKGIRDTSLYFFLFFCITISSYWHILREILKN